MLRVFARFTLFLTLLAALTGCANLIQRRTALEAFAPDQPTPITSHKPLIINGVYATTEFAPAAEKLFLAYQVWNETWGNPAPPPVEEFFPAQVDSIDSVDGKSYGPFGKNVEVYLTVHNPANFGQTRFVQRVTIPGYGELICGTIFVATYGDQIQRWTKHNADIENHRWHKGGRSVMNWLHGQWGRVGFKTKPGQFRNGVSDFVCITPSKDGKPATIGLLLGPAYDMTWRNLEFYAFYDGALKEAVDAAVVAGQAKDITGIYQTRVTKQGTPIANCENTPHICGPYQGPQMFHHVRYVGEENGCYRVWAISYGRRFRTLDYADASVTQDVFVRFIDCNGNIDYNVPQAQEIVDY